MQDTKSPSFLPSLGSEKIHQACSNLCKGFGFQHFLFISKNKNRELPRLIIIQGSSGDRVKYSERATGLIRISKQEGFSSDRIDALFSKFPSDIKKQLVTALLSSNINMPLVNSVSFPVYEQNEATAVLILTATLEQQCRSLSAAQFSRAQEFVKNIYKAVNSPAISILSATVKLTQRELECLHWAALGKTNEEIGMILSVTKRTVVFHLQNAATKLETSNRYHTVARAISKGLIEAPI